MIGKKMPLLALGLLVICTQCDPLVNAAAGPDLEDHMQATVASVTAATSDQEKYVEALVDCINDYDNDEPGGLLVEKMIPSIDQVVNRKNELAEAERLATEKAERIATRKAQVSQRIQVRAKALADARAKAQAEKEAAERALEMDATGSWYAGVRLMSTEPYEISRGHLTRSNGTVRYNGHRETWYSTKESVGQATAVRIPGKHIAKDGTIRDAEGYICVAASQKYMRVYSTLMTSLGPAKVYDTGCSYGTIDVYTCW